MSDSLMVTDDFGRKYWVNSKGHLHRINGPAVEYSNGDKLWYKDDSLHRINGPAIEWADGEKAWYVNGECLGLNNEGFQNLWKRLTPEQKKDPTLLSYFLGGYNV